MAEQPAVLLVLPASHRSSVRSRDPGACTEAYPNFWNSYTLPSGIGGVREKGAPIEPPFLTLTVLTLYRVRILTFLTPFSRSRLKTHGLTFNPDGLVLQQTFLRAIEGLALGIALAVTECLIAGSPPHLD